MKRNKIIEGILPTHVAKNLQPGTRLYQLNGCTIFVSPPTHAQGWHMSIAHDKRYPHWREIHQARYELLPNNINMAMILPTPEEYINVHKNCFHLHQIPDNYKSLCRLRV